MSKITPHSFYYVRHGQTDWNREHRAMGQKDIPLNEHGISQALKARNSLIGLGIKTICHSPLLRAKATAEILNESLNCSLIAIDELQEFNLGSYSGKMIGSWFENWRKGDVLTHAETYSDFTQRCITGINRALVHLGPVLIVAHGGVYWALEEALNMFLQQDLPNCVPVFCLAPQNGDEKWKITLLG